MARTRTTPTARLAPTYGTSSGTNPGEDFEAPEDLSDIARIDAEIPRGNARPTGSLLQPKPKPRSPIGLEVGKSAGGGLGVVVALPLGAGPISGRGGINLGAGGSIKGGSLGLGFGLGPIGTSIDVGTDQNEAGEGGCYQYVTVAAGPFSHTYGRNVCEPKSVEPTPAPTPSPAPTPTPDIGIDLPDTEELGWVVFNMQQLYYLSYASTPSYNNTTIRTISDIQEKDRIVQILPFKVVSTKNPYNSTNYTINKGTIIHLFQTYTTTGIFGNMSVNACQPNPPYQYIFWYVAAFYGKVKNIKQFIELNKKNNDAAIADRLINSLHTSRSFYYYIPTQFIPLMPSPSPLSPPIPNPPPRKKMDDTCCKQSLILQVEILRLLGRELGPNGLVPQTKKAGFIGEEIERTETPILDPEKPKKIKVRFETVYDLLKYALKQANNLDTALDPQSYKAPTGKVQNPAYNRDSEQSLKSNNQPNKDKAGNRRELEINKDDEVKMGGFLQQQRYVFDALRRLEYLFPSGELSDALIAKSLLIPGAKDDIKIHNMIMAYEIMMQYINATLGNPREALIIKDANPALKGDQPIEVKALTISDWMRQVVKFQVDTGGDVDAAINLLLRDFRTNLANRTDIIKTAEMTQALFEDSGMQEQQDYIKVHLEGDPYAGQWVKGQGFKANPDLEKKTEEATEKVLRETMNPTEIKIKVSRRHKDEKTDMRDLFRGLADFVQRLLSIPSAGDAAKSIDKLIESAKFKVQTDMALIRQNVSKAATASRNRTKKRKK